jgi:hypothetical protein
MAVVVRRVVVDGVAWLVFPAGPPDPIALVPGGDGEYLINEHPVDHHGIRHDAIRSYAVWGRCLTRTLYPIHLDEPGGMSFYENFDQLPQLSSFFPLVFSNGARWESIVCRCKWCGTTASDLDVRGSVHIHMTGGYRDTERTYVVDGFMYCLECKRFSVVRLNLPSDMSASGPDPQTEAWARWPPRRASWWSRVRRWWQRVQP